MAKGKGKRKERRRRVDHSESDAESSKSQNSDIESLCDKRTTKGKETGKTTDKEIDKAHQLEDCINELVESKANRTGAYIPKLLDILQQSYDPTTVSQHHETLIWSILRYLKRAPASSVVSVLDCLGAILLNVASSGLSLTAYEDIESTLTSLIRTTTSAVNRGALAKAYGLLAAIGCDTCDAKLEEATRFFCREAMETFKLAPPWMNTKYPECQDKRTCTGSCRIRSAQVDEARESHCNLAGAMCLLSDDEEDIEESIDLNNDSNNVEAATLEEKEISKRLSVSRDSVASNETSTTATGSVPEEEDLDPHTAVTGVRRSARDDPSQWVIPLDSAVQAEGFIEGWTLVTSARRHSELACFSKFPTSELFSYARFVIEKSSSQAHAAAEAAAVTMALIIHALWESERVTFVEELDKDCVMRDVLKSLGQLHDKLMGARASLAEKKSGQTVRSVLFSAASGKALSVTKALSCDQSRVVCLSGISFFWHGACKNYLKGNLCRHLADDDSRFIDLIKIDKGDVGRYDNTGVSEKDKSLRAKRCEKRRNKDRNCDRDYKHSMMWN